MKVPTDIVDFVDSSTFEFKTVFGNFAMEAELSMPYSEFSTEHWNL